MYLNESLFLQFLSEKEITWLGVDFSLAKFTKEGFNFPIEVLQYFFNEWNMLIISDQKKYDIRMAFRKPLMHYDLSFVSKKNRSLKLSNLLVNNLTIKDQYTDEEIVEHVKTLEISELGRFTLLFFVESFDHKSKSAAIWVVLFESTTNEVILCEKFLETPAGFGTRNYWARTFYNLLFDIKKKSFLRWTNLVKPENLIK